MEETINSTLTAVMDLRATVGQCFERLANGSNGEQANDGRPQFLHDYQDDSRNIRLKLCHLEEHINGLAPLPTLNIEHNILLELDGSWEFQPLCSPLDSTFKWLQKLHSHSAMANRNMISNDMACSYMLNSQKEDVQMLTIVKNSNPEYSLADLLINDLNLRHTTYKICREFDPNVIIFVTISHVLKAAIICRGIFLEWITVKGYDEPLDHKDLWTESRYEVFRKVQDHSHSAMICYSYPKENLAFANSMIWLNSYFKLFLEPCRRCGKFVLNGLPPTWRDFRKMEPYHYECRNC